MLDFSSLAFFDLLHTHISGTFSLFKVMVRNGEDVSNESGLVLPSVCHDSTNSDVVKMSDVEDHFRSSLPHNVLFISHDYSLDCCAEWTIWFA